jgi:large subunit ribosomal protein L25
VDGAAVGTRILAGEITLPEGVELRTDPEYLVVNVVASPTAEDLAGDTAGEEAAPEEAEPAEEQS